MKFPPAFRNSLAFIIWKLTRFTNTKGIQRIHTKQLVTTYQVYTNMIIKLNMGKRNAKLPITTLSVKNNLLVAKRYGKATPIHLQLLRFHFHL